MDVVWCLRFVSQTFVRQIDRKLSEKQLNNLQNYPSATPIKEVRWNMTFCFCYVFAMLSYVCFTFSMFSIFFSVFLHFLLFIILGRFVYVCYVFERSPLLKGLNLPINPFEGPSKPRRPSRPHADLAACRCGCLAAEGNQLVEESKNP